MNALVQKIVDLYKSNAWFRGLVQAVEGAALVSLADATANGFQFTRTEWKHLAAAIGTGVVVAVRNYLVASPRQLPPPQPSK